MSATPMIVDFSDCVLTPGLSYFDAVARRVARRQRREQGLSPMRIKDQSLLDRIAAIVRGGK